MSNATQDHKGDLVPLPDNSTKNMVEDILGKYPLVHDDAFDDLIEKLDQIDLHCLNR